MNIQYVYLIQTEEFVKSGEPVYKIGKTTQLNYARFRQYDTGSIQLYQSICKNCDDIEKKIIKLFNSKYERHCGKEYFRGNYDDMLDDISELVQNERLISGLVSDIVSDIIENIVDIAVEETIAEEVVDEEVVDKCVNVNTKTVGIVEFTCSKKCEIDEADDDETNEVTNDIRNIQNKKFGCIPCNYYSDYNGNVKQHKKTTKHIEVISEQEGGGGQKRVKTENVKVKCPKCAKIYFTQSGCWKHTKKCPFPIPLPPNPSNPSNPSFDPTELINEIKELKMKISPFDPTELINEIKELKMKMIENN